MSEYSAYASCPKCKATPCTTSYNPVDDTLRRGCPRCDYAWSEQPASPTPASDVVEAIQAAQDAARRVAGLFPGMEISKTVEQFVDRAAQTKISIDLSSLFRRGGGRD